MSRCKKSPPSTNPDLTKKGNAKGKKGKKPADLKPADLKTNSFILAQKKKKK